MKKVLLYLWQLPQNLVGLVVVKITGAERGLYTIHDKMYKCYATNKIRSSGSLGDYVILKRPQQETIPTILHEYGHCRQSRYLGWLYLPIVGLSSWLHNLFCKCTDHDYYDFWTEKWADRLGGITR